jgi:hypothetical protein
MHNGQTQNRRPWYTSNHGATSTSSAMATFLVVRATSLAGFHADLISTYKALGLNPLVVCTFAIASHLALAAGSGASYSQTKPSSSSSCRFNLPRSFYTSSFSLPAQPLGSPFSSIAPRRVTALSIGRQGLSAVGSAGGQKP